MLEVKNLDAFYGAMQVLHGVNLAVGTGEIVGLVGANAAGKSSLMFSLAGLRTACRGEVLLDGAPIQDLAPWERPSKGLVLVPERRRLFPFMTRARKSRSRRLCAGGARGDLAIARRGLRAAADACRSGAARSRVR